ncbi:MAG: lysozyme inhibitor LprI family protein [Leptolyngbyaceae bacterium]|nr:lysozyme inhibitor LprI family protein [Leptolyngbyaceae bacterium]
MKSFLRSNLWVVLSCLTIPPVAGTVVALTLHNHVPQSVTQTSEGAVSETITLNSSDQTFADQTFADQTQANTSVASAETPESALTHSEGGPQSTPQASASPESANPTLTAQNPDFNCDNPQYQLEMNYCASLDYQRADEGLNRTYGDLMAVIPDARREKLIAAEQAWIQYRDTTCEFERSQYEGGSIEPMIYHSCMARLTQDQTLLLKSYLDEYN